MKTVKITHNGKLVEVVPVKKYSRLARIQAENKNAVGSNQYITFKKINVSVKRKKQEVKKHNSMPYLYWFLFVVAFLIVGALVVKANPPHDVQAQEKRIVVITPSPTVAPTASPTPTMTQREKQDKWIGEQADRFAKPQIGKSASYLRYQLHCLAYMENGHHANTNRGDNGLASGMYQYHEGTYEGFRKIMIKKGLTTYMGDRDLDFEAIETTAWALADGRENNWGPIVNRRACINQ